MNENKIRKAVIYCRVANLSDGSSGRELGAQGGKCEEYANRFGYNVARIFNDQGSGLTSHRVATNELIGFLADNLDSTVLVESISRIGRSLETVEQIRSQIRAAAARLICVDREPSLEVGSR